MKTVGRICTSVLLLTVTTAAGAQPADTEVQDIFQSGNAALRAGRFHEARDLLRDAHKSAQGVGTAFNLAVALRGTGEVLECTAIFDRLLAGDFGQVTASVRDQSQLIRTECDATVGTLFVQVNHPATVRVDGVVVGPAVVTAPLKVRVDPGPHVVSAASPEHTNAEARVDVDRAGEANLRLVLLTLPKLKVPTPPAAAEANQLEPVAKADSPLNQTWFWLVIAGVAVAAGGVALGVALRDPSVADPVGSPWADPQVIP